MMDWMKDVLHSPAHGQPRGDCSTDQDERGRSEVREAWGAARFGRSHSAMFCRIFLFGDGTSRRTLRSPRAGLKTVMSSFDQALVLALLLACSGVLPGVCAMPVQPLLDVPPNAAIYGGREIDCPIVDAPARQLAAYRMPQASHGWCRHTAGMRERVRTEVSGCSGGGGTPHTEAGRHDRAASPLRLAGGWWGSGSTAAAGEGSGVASGGGGVETGVYRTLATAGHMHMSFYGFMCDLRATYHTPP